MRKRWSHSLDRNRVGRRARPVRRRVDDVDAEAPRKGGDPGRYMNGYRVYRDGTEREDFGADR